MKLSFENDIRPLIDKFEEILGLSFKVFLVTSLIVMALGVYIANLLFGNHSLQVLERLKKEEVTLTKEIEVLKNQNAKLHKKYLEWKDAQ
jgi:cell division protein FtsB